MKKNGSLKWCNDLGSTRIWLSSYFNRYGGKHLAVHINLWDLYPGRMKNFGQTNSFIKNKARMDWLNMSCTIMRKFSAIKSDNQYF